ncbi:SUMO1 sentrin specific peptidase 8 [Apophysomyces ossiformis]|uniref:SUMO1 sentrin specific peptidase 8 n=1 Tax=Apophysomyces ossiformis TaxID=679940 RepID=A0A8H7BY85_9FUNG|nr:SUMO1 sentrin specific peptidase 8 [Apophysomyces ossiformis]
MNSDILLHFHDVVVREYDYDTLADGQWINDTIIDFHAEYLEREYLPKDNSFLFLRPGMVQLIRHTPGKRKEEGDSNRGELIPKTDPTQLGSALPANIDQRLVIFIPINDGEPQTAYSGSHWSLLVFLRATATFYYYDSMQGANLNEARATAMKLLLLLKLSQHPEFIPVPTPQQENGADCGVYVISITDLLVQRMLHYPNSTIEEFVGLKEGDMASPGAVRQDLKTLLLRLTKNNSANHI